ncbi:MAG: hypothetical protein KIT31_29825 [Deltaproteobacteria bacterium]|nr:hypothetical protein [Deltaproteobacteria bacterium]
MRRHLWPVLLLASTPACTLGDRALDGCPPEEEPCSDSTPGGIDFAGARAVGDSIFDGNHATAVGGTQAITLFHGDTGRPVTEPYVATAVPSFTIERTGGPVVTLRAKQRGASHLTIRDPEGALMDRKVFKAAEILRIDLAVARYESTQLPIAFLPGKIELGIALRGAGGDRLVDQSMTLELAGATQKGWDTLVVPDATAGTHAIAVTAGGLPPVDVDVTVVAAAEQLVEHVPAEPLVVGQPGSVCFDAVAQDHHVAGLTWTFDSDNGPGGTFGTANCAFLVPERAGTLTLTAGANGLQRTLSLVVQPAPPQARVAPEARLGGVAGERAEALAQ